eukprot:6579972-Pyramimonas_sp.AAC.1
MAGLAEKAAALNAEQLARKEGKDLVGKNSSAAQIHESIGIVLRDLCSLTCEHKLNTDMSVPASPLDDGSAFVKLATTLSYPVEPLRSWPVDVVKTKGDVLAKYLEKQGCVCLRNVLSSETVDK